MQGAWFRVVKPVPGFRADLTNERVRAASNPDLIEPPDLLFALPLSDVRADGMVLVSWRGNAYFVRELEFSTGAIVPA